MPQSWPSAKESDRRCSIGFVPARVKRPTSKTTIRWQIQRLILPITPGFLVGDASSPMLPFAPRVRIRSLINERCVTCHNEDGDDTARLVPFDTYESIARYLRPGNHMPMAAVPGCSLPSFRCFRWQRSLDPHSPSRAIRLRCAGDFQL